MVPFFLSVAVPAPLPRVFDYLPLADHSMQHYQIGQRVSVPFAGRRLCGVITDIHQQPSIEPSKVKPIGDLIDSKPLLDPQLLELGRWISMYYHQPIGEVFALFWPVLLRKGQAAQAAHETKWGLTQTQPSPTELARAPRQLALYEYVANVGDTLQSELIKAGFTPAIIKGLAEKGFIQASNQPSFKTIWGQGAEPPKILNDQQQTALERIQATEGFAPILLEGITGSGKTEVYLQAIEPALRAGQQVLVLLPEIGLTPQTVSRFEKRFNAEMLLLHSKLTDRERLEAWLKAKSHDGKQGQIIIGTRSALFTPLPNLSMIIIDEEHDASFKQQEGVRYHGRDVAVMRAKHAQIPIILGSATPSLDSLHNGLSGKYIHVRITKRAGLANPPALKIFNIKKQAQQHGLADELLSLIQEKLDAQQQVLVFINRRGFAPTLYCPDCGWSSACKRCDAKMTLHQSPPHLHCHHCDNKQTLPQSCPECFSQHIHPLGVGTERLEHHLAQHFSSVPVIRIDKDSTQAKNRLSELLEPVHNGEPCILVGTQMLAKGHHFPNVNLVIVVNMDAGFFSADFRSMERTAQLLLQVAGRAGRAELAGSAVIQTEFAQHPMLHVLCKEGYHALALAQLQERFTQRLPPYGYQALVRANSHQQKEAEHFLYLVKQHFIQAQEAQHFKNVRLLGPLPAPMELKAGKFRSQLWVHANQRKILHSLLASVVPNIHGIKGFHRVRWSLDVDPIDNF